MKAYVIILAKERQMNYAVDQMLTQFILLIVRIKFSLITRYLRSTNRFNYDQNKDYNISLSCPTTAESGQVISCKLSVITMGRSVNVQIDFNDTKILYLYGLNNQTVIVDKSYTREGVYYISALMMNNTNNQQVKDNQMINIWKKNVFNIIYFETNKFRLDSSQIIDNFSGLLMRCLTRCLKNMKCESLIFNNTSKICFQYKNTQLIPGIYADNGISKIYTKSIRP